MRDEMSKHQRTQRSHAVRRPRQRSRAGDRFEAIVERVLDSLPPNLEPALSEVAVVVEDWPNDVDPDDAPYGWYEGTPTSLTADEPRKITIFRGPLEADFPRRADLEHEVRLTIEHELAHHFSAVDRDEYEEEDGEDEAPTGGMRARLWRWLTRP